MTPEQAKMVTSKYTFWYEADWDYAQPTAIFFCVGIACAIILNLVFRLRNGKSTSQTKTSLVDRGAAIIRYTVARQYRVRLFHWYSPPLAAIIAISAILTFIMALTLGPRPYLWPNLHVMGHSPPIATRTGWLSIAIMPFMIAFATKVNWIGVLTGTSHEKLQVFHRWTAFIMYITSLVHTFPFIVQSIQLGEMETNWKTTPWYWSGVAALVPQTYLVFMSWGFLRNKYYETFKKLHFIAAGIFMAALFIHCNFRLTSWDYFAATAGLWFAVYCFRHFRTIYNSGLGIPATLEALPDGMIKLSIHTPSRLKWSPGQHVLVRVLSSGIHAFSSHPFTISSLSEEGKLELAFKVHDGITRKLASMVSGKPSRSIRVAIDGPYGGVPSLKGYDHIYLLAGGAGITLTLPLLKQLIKDNATNGVEFVLAVKNRETTAWLEESLAAARQAGVHTRVHITGPSAQNDLKQHNEDEESVSDSEHDLKQPVQNILPGRPNLPSVVREAVKTHSGRIAIVACGPESFLYDVRNTVAECQLVIADGYGACKDLFLHTENYSW
ncbi:ferric-chelate reductase [Moniliophthora roreri MCA 2997]|uniref:ferric-chelate reductase (NADPH) n=1 Tax=Moniliophthora roreri (strain MCA 2997) TaxID=1381753 RepID=V2YKF4_MONRO|nr:ferric-chelate reductase [Moniliophthora roreri MCA 2997]